MAGRRREGADPHGRCGAATEWVATHIRSWEATPQGAAAPLQGLQGDPSSARQPGNKSLMHYTQTLRRGALQGRGETQQLHAPQSPVNRPAPYQRFNMFCLYVCMYVFMHVCMYVNYGAHCTPDPPWKDGSPTLCSCSRFLPR